MKQIPRYKKFPLTVLALCFWTVANCQQPQDSLMQYLEMAAKNNPSVMQKFSEYQAALQKVPQVGSLPDPELSVGVFLSPMEQVGGNQVADIRLMQMFPWFGVLKNAKDEMSLMAKAKFESFRTAKLQVFYDVQRTWFELYKIRKDIDISEKNLEILHTIERLALVKFSAPADNGSTAPSSGNETPAGTSQNAASGTPSMQGSSSMQGNTSGVLPGQPSQAMQSNSMSSQAGNSGLAGLYKLQMEAGELDNNIALLKNQWNTVSALFNSYLDRPVTSPVAVPDTLKADTLTLSLAAISDSMLAVNPMLTMLQYDQQSLEARKQMVTRMGFPMVGLGVNYSLINKSAMSTSSMNGRDMIMPMITVTLPIYRKKYKAMQAEADLLKTAVSQEYRATANTLQAEYYEALQLYQDANRRIKLYAHQSQLASKTLDLAIKSFSVSGGDLADILRIRQQKLDYEFKQVEAVTDYNTAIAWLKRLMAFSQFSELNK